MVRTTYGKTAWGKAFLDALGHLDVNKRLARGKSYANTGKVLSISINGCKVTAKVQGNYGVYDVLVKFQEFNIREKESVYNIVDRNPIILAHILNGELPDGLLQELYKANISLLPTSWYQISARCSCPDDGDPCKHMAAVYFLVTSEIDKNPFTLFLLREVDLKKYFHVKNSEVEPSYPLPVKELPKSLKVEKKDLENCELLKIPPLGNFIMDCLTPNPPFSPQLDYKSVMTEFYSYTSKKNVQVITSLQNDKFDPFDNIDAELFQRVWSNSNFQFKIADKFGKMSVLVRNEIFNNGFDISSILSTIPKSVEFLPGKEDRKEKVVVLDIFTAFQVFLNCTSDFGTPSYCYFYFAFRIALLLINSQALIPDVLPLSYSRENDKIVSFKIIWKPLYSCSIVLEQLDKLSNVYPQRMADVPGVVLLDGKHLDANSGSLHCLTAVLTQFVKKLQFCHKKLKNNPPKETLAFFFGQVYHIFSLAEHNVPKAITKYFGVFDLMKTDFEVAIHVTKEDEKRNDTFCIGLWLKNSGSIACNALPLKDFIRQSPLFKNQILKFLSALSPYLANVEQFLIRDKISLTSDDLEKLLLQTAKLFANLGVEVVLPRELRKLLKPRAVVRTFSEESLDDNHSQRSFLKLDELLSYNWVICIGDEQITIDEFQSLVSSGKKLFKFKDQYIAISAEEMKNILSSVRKPPPSLSGLNLLKETLRENSIFMLDSDVETFLKRKLAVTEHMIPTTLNCTLREYQVKGYRWLVSNMINGFGCILADDMGLGKTVQMIAAIAYLKESGYLKNSTLLVVPSSLISNWTREIHRFSPDITVYTYYGLGRKITLNGASSSQADISFANSPITEVDTFNNGVKSERKRFAITDTNTSTKRLKKSPSPSYDIILTTYSIAWRDLAQLQKQHFGLVCIDEAQYIKNNNSQTCQALKKIKAPLKVALSGTPVENNLSELWSVFDFVLPKYLGPLKDFKNTYSKPIEIHCDQEKLDDLKTVCSPFLLRRLKTDKSVIKDLPSKIVDNKYATLSAEQAALYESVVQTITQQIKTCKGIQRRGLIFKLLTSLKQICNHPANYNESEDENPDVSGKVRLLLELLHPILKAGEKVLIFSQYVKMIHLLEKIIEKKYNVKPLVFEGSMTQEKRDIAVNEFQNYPYRQIFLISLKAGGVGLNLTAGNHVIHYDLWYNPAVENQATDRAFRIGQQKNVFVHRLITQHTFEEKIDEMIKQKQNLSDMSVSVKESWITELSNEEIKDLFTRTT